MYAPDSYEEMMTAAYAGNGCITCGASTHTEDDCSWEKAMDCPHENVDHALGYRGDPAEEDPFFGTCQDCYTDVHLTEDGWERE